MRVWVDRTKEHRKEKRSRELDKKKLLFAGTYVIAVTSWGYLVIFWPRRLQGKRTESVPPSTCRTGDSGAVGTPPVLVFDLSPLSLPCL